MHIFPPRNGLSRDPHDDAAYRRQSSSANVADATAQSQWRPPLPDDQLVLLGGATAPSAQVAPPEARACVIRESLPARRALSGVFGELPPSSFAPSFAAANVGERTQAVGNDSDMLVGPSFDTDRTTQAAPPADHAARAATAARDIQEMEAAHKAAVRAAMAARKKDARDEAARGVDEAPWADSHGDAEWYHSDALDAPTAGDKVLKRPLGAPKTAKKDIGKKGSGKKGVGKKGVDKKGSGKKGVGKASDKKGSGKKGVGKTSDGKNGVGKASDAVASMPTPGNPVLYQGAKIASSASKGGFRIWLDPSIVGHEKFVPFGDDEKASFRAACKLVSSNRK